MAKYKCVIIPNGDPSMRDLQVLSSDGFWSYVAYIQREDCKRFASLGLTTEIIASYVRRNNVPHSELPGLIGDVHASIVQASLPAEDRPQPAATPQVSATASVKPDYIVSLENGRGYKSLRRHLSKLGLTPDEYRRKWKLPPDYPMVAPNYSRARSALAKTLGLGRKRSGGRRGAGGNTDQT